MCDAPCDADTPQGAVLQQCYWETPPCSLQALPVQLTETFPHDTSWCPHPAHRCPSVCGPSRSVLSPAHVAPSSQWLSGSFLVSGWVTLPHLSSVHGDLGHAQILAVVNMGAPASLPGPAVILWINAPAPQPWGSHVTRGLTSLAALAMAVAVARP